MCKLDFKEAEEPKIKLSTFVGSWGKQWSSRKTCTSASLTVAKPLTVWTTTNCGKFLKRWEYHLTCLLRNLCAGQEATVRTVHGTMDWFQIGKGVSQGCILTSPANLTYTQSISCKMPGWMKHKLESRLYQ